MVHCSNLRIWVRPKREKIDETDIFEDMKKVVQALEKELAELKEEDTRLEKEIEELREREKRDHSASVYAVKTAKNTQYQNNLSQQAIVETAMEAYSRGTFNDPLTMYYLNTDVWGWKYDRYFSRISSIAYNDLKNYDVYVKLKPEEGKALETHIEDNKFVKYCEKIIECEEELLNSSSEDGGGNNAEERSEKSIVDEEDEEENEKTIEDDEDNCEEKD